MKNPTSSEKLVSQKSMCNYLKIFKTLFHFKFDALVSQKYLSGPQMELLLSKMALIILREKYAKTRKIQIANYISCKDILTCSVKVDFNYISMFSSH